MKLDLQIEIPDATILSLVKAKGCKVLKHDFGQWRKEHHNKLEWYENTQAAVYIDQQPYTIIDAFKILYGFEVKKAVMQGINQQFSKIL